MQAKHITPEQSKKIERVAKEAGISSINWRRIVRFLKDINGCSLDEVESIEEALRQIREAKAQKKDT